MKLIIDIPEEQIPTKQEIIYIPIHFIDKQVVEAGGLGFMQIPDNATNGDVIKAVFPFPQHRIPLYHWTDAKDSIWALLDDKTESSWWNAPYRGSEE